MSKTAKSFELHCNCKVFHCVSDFFNCWIMFFSVLMQKETQLTSKSKFAQMLAVLNDGFWNLLRVHVCHCFNWNVSKLVELLILQHISWNNCSPFTWGTLMEKDVIISFSISLTNIRKIISIILSFDNWFSKWGKANVEVSFFQNAVFASI